MVRWWRITGDSILLRFLHSDLASYWHLEDIEPSTVAAYIEMLSCQAAPPAVKRKSESLLNLCIRAVLTAHPH